MSAWKMPPLAKVYEALTAVADHRVTITDAASAQVLSSTRAKTYQVEWSADLREITANDNASYWQGYIGYPIIAALLQLGKLVFDAHLAAQLAGVPWKKINDQFKRDYDKAVDHVLDQVEAAGGSREAIRQEVERICRQLEALGLQRAKPRRRPPPAKRD